MTSHGAPASNREGSRRDAGLEHHPSTGMRVGERIRVRGRYLGPLATGMLTACARSLLAGMPPHLIGVGWWCSFIAPVMLPTQRGACGATLLEAVLHLPGAQGSLGWAGSAWEGPTERSGCVNATLRLC